VLPPWVAIAGVLVAVVVVLYILGKGTGHKSPSGTNAQTAPVVKHHHHHHRRPVTPAAPTNVKLELVPTGTVYVCLEDGHGRPLIRGTIFNVGQTIPTFTRDKLLLTLGNASVHMKVNGKPVTVAPSSSSIGYKLVPGGMSSLPVSQQPKCA